MENILKGVVIAVSSSVAIYMSSSACVGEQKLFELLMWNEMLHGV